MRKTGNNARGYGVAIGGHDNGDCRGRALGGKDSRCIRHDDVNFGRDKFSGQSGKPVTVSVREAKLNLEVLAFDVAQVAKARAKFVDRTSALGRRPEIKIPDPRNP